MWYLYILRCSDGSLYTGITTDIERRVGEHNNGRTGAKAIKGKLPAVLVYSEEYPNMTEAAKREREIKSWKREKKMDLIGGLP